MLALIFFGFKAVFKHINLAVSLSLSLFLFLNLIYQRYVVSNQLFPVLFELIDLVFECGNQL